MYQVYQVQSGETLNTIARKLGISIDELNNLNGINNGEVVPGNFIVIPRPNNNMFEIYTVIKGDNLYEIARRYNTDFNILLLLNGLNKDDYIYPNQEILIPRPNTNFYITEESDTINSILEKSGISINDLINQNDTIYVTPDQLIMIKKEQNI